MGSLNFSRSDRGNGWTSVPHRLWDLDLRTGPKMLLIWLHSHSDDFLARLTLSKCRRAVGSSSIYPWFDALEAAGFLKVARNEAGRPARITLLVKPWEALYEGSNQSDFGPATSPKSDDREEHLEQQGSSSLRSEEDHQSQVVQRAKGPSAVGVEAAQAFWDWHTLERHKSPVSAFQAVRAVATALAKKGYTADEIVDGLKATRVMSAKAVQDEIEQQRRRAENAAGPVVPQSVLRAFHAAQPWLRSRDVMFDVDGQRARLMRLVAGFVAQGFGVGEAMLRMAVAYRAANPHDDEAMRAAMWRARVDRFPGELADYPDAMERAFHNQYWRAA